MQGIDGKIALVTGASSGIGRTTALAFAQHGARVVVSDRREREGQETVALIRERGGEAIFVEADVASAAQVEALIETTVATYGRLDFAFNNAGVSGPTVALADYTEDDWDQVIAVNLKGVWLCMKYQIRQMLAQGGGAIVNTSSAGGLVGFPGISPYIATKHGVLGLTKTAALEYVRAGIRINAVCPGGIQTEMVERLFPEGSEARSGFVGIHPIGRLGRPDDVSGAVVWLCSADAAFVTGTALAIDGGLTAG